MREESILSWLKYYRNSGQICKKNQNDHDPQMEFRNFPDEEEASVEETARVGQLVSIISVTDLDLEDRGWAVVSIIEGNEAGQFTVDSVEDIHIIRVVGQLDRETTRQYQLTLQAEDGGTPPRTSTAILVINVVVPGRKLTKSDFIEISFQ